MHYFICNDYTMVYWQLKNFSISKILLWLEFTYRNLNISGTAVMMPACHANFKTKLNQVNTDTGEQYLDTGQQGKIPPDLESCLLEAERALPLDMNLYARCSLRNTAFVTYSFRAHTKEN